MSTPVLPEYVAPYKPVPQITPFTYRDGVTMIKKLELLTKYINKTVVPWINENYTELADAFEAEVNKLITEVNNALAAQIVIVDEKLEQQDIEVDQKINTLEQYVNDQVAAIIGSSITAQDPVVAGIMGNAGSDTRGVTDTLYADKSVEGDVSTIEATLSGRLSDETLREEFMPRVRDDAKILTPAKDATKVANLGNTKMQVPSIDYSIYDSGHEWWCGPVITRGNRKTYGAGYASNGEIVAWDKNDREGLIAVVVDDNGPTSPAGAVDDHNAPARWVSAEEDFSLMMWNTHSATSSLYARVSLDGTANGFTTTDTVEITFANAVSYNQVFMQSLIGDIYRFLILTRTAGGWSVRYISVNKVTGAIDSSEPTKPFLTTAGKQNYVTGVLDGRILRVATYCNPATDTHAIWVFTLNIDSGEITNPRDAAFTHNLDDGIIDTVGLPSLVADIPDTQSRRLYYHHPKATRVLYSEWTRGSEANAVYKEAILDEGLIYTRSFGVAGPRIGYTAGSNYNPGMCYDTDGEFIISAHNLVDGTGTINVHDLAKSWITRRTDYPVARPFAVKNKEVVYLAVDNYAAYTNFLMHQVAQHGYPVIENLPVDPTATHELVVPGTIYLVDSSFSSWRFPAWPSGIPTEIVNLADGTPININSTIVGGLIERTGRGALHVAPPRTGGTQSLTMQSQEVYNNVQPNQDHTYFLASSYRITRNAIDNGSNVGAGRWLGWITPAGSIKGVITVASGTSDLTVVNARQQAGTPTNRQDALNTVAAGVQLVAGQVSWATADMGTSISQSVFSSGTAMGASSRIQYFDYIEDLTVSGRTYAQALAAVQAYHNKIHGVGGVFANDTWTTPTA